MFPLGIDPPYLGWSDVESTNKYWMHNVIEIDNNLSSDPNLNNVYRSPTISAIENKSSVFKEFTLSYLYSNNLIYYGTSIKRNVIQISNTSNVYYFIADYLDATNLLGDFRGIN
jgi:hypothetical protein